MGVIKLVIQFVQLAVEVGHHGLVGIIIQARPITSLFLLFQYLIIVREETDVVCKVFMVDLVELGRRRVVEEGLVLFVERQVVEYFHNVVILLGLHVRQSLMLLLVVREGLQRESVRLVLVLQVHH